MCHPLCSYHLHYIYIFIYFCFVVWKLLLVIYTFNKLNNKLQSGMAISCNLGTLWRL